MIVSSDKTKETVVKVKEKKIGITKCHKRQKRQIVNPFSHGVHLRVRQFEWWTVDLPYFKKMVILYTTMLQFIFNSLNLV